MNSRQTSTLYRDGQTHSYICVHANSCGHTQMLYISTFWMSCVYTRMTGCFLCPKHYHYHIRWEQSGRRRKLQTAIVFTCEKRFVSSLTSSVASHCSNQESLYNPVIGSVILKRSPSFDSKQDDCLERGIYFPYPRLWHSGCKLSNICFCVHKSKLSTWRNIQTFMYLHKGATSFQLFSFCGAIMVIHSFHGININWIIKTNGNPLFFL